MYSDGISDAKVVLLRQVWTLHPIVVVVRKKKWQGYSNRHIYDWYEQCNVRWSWPGDQLIMHGSSFETRTKMSLMLHPWRVSVVARMPPSVVTLYSLIPNLSSSSQAGGLARCASSTARSSPGSVVPCVPLLVWLMLCLITIFSSSSSPPRTDLDQSLIRIELRDGPLYSSCETMPLRLEPLIGLSGVMQNHSQAHTSFFRIPSVGKNHYLRMV